MHADNTIAAKLSGIGRNRLPHKGSFSVRQSYLLPLEKLSSGGASLVDLRLTMSG